MKRTMMIIGMVLMVFVIGAYAVDLADPGLKSEGKIGLKDLSSLIASNNALIEAYLNAGIVTPGVAVPNYTNAPALTNTAAVWIKYTWTNSQVYVIPMFQLND